MSHRHKKRSSREFRQDLRTIYTGKDGKIPDLTRLAQHKTSKLTRFLLKTIVFLFIVSLLTWGSFFLFTQGLFDSNQTLTTSIETEKTIRAGEETALTIRYENTGDVPIAALDMKLNLPTSFHLTSTMPEPTAEQQWTIGSLTPHSDGAIIVKGIFLSEIPSSQRIQALFTYKPANFNSEFQKIKTTNVDLKESTIEMNITGPEKALAGDQVEYTLKIKHTGKDPVFNLRVLPVLPADFVIISSNPALNADEHFWEIPTLNPEKIQDVTFSGTFTSTASGDLTVGAIIGFMDEETLFEQIKTQVQTNVLGGAVSFHLILDGSDKDQTVQPGKTIRGSIDYKNPGTDSVEGVSFTLHLSSNASVPIAWDKANLSDGVHSNNQVVWNKKTTPALEKIDPGKEGVIDFTLPLHESISEGSSDVFTVSVSMDVEKIGSITSTRTIEATPIQLAIASNVSLSAYALYFAEDGTPLGSGDVPPHVGASTSYRIIWDLKNSLHDLGTVEVSTILPQDVAWTDLSGKDIGILSYNPTTRQVRWQISKLPNDIKNAQAWFNVTVTPKTSDVGTFMKLTNQLSLEATDLTTKTQTNSSLPLITTELPLDTAVSGKSVVTK